MFMARENMGNVGSSVMKLQQTAKHYTGNLKQIFQEKELRGYSPNFHIPVSVSD
jgi:hypothetical protein